MAGEAEDLFSQYRVVTLNGHDLYDGRSAEVRDQKIDCLLRDCKLQPGQHTIDVEYRWNSLEAEKERRRSESWQALVSVLGGSLPDSQYYPCHASISFEVQSAHDYFLNVVHTDQTKDPEEFQILEAESRAVVGRSRPTC